MDQQCAASEQFSISVVFLCRCPQWPYAATARLHPSAGCTRHRYQQNPMSCLWWARCRQCRGHLPLRTAPPIFLAAWQRDVAKCSVRASVEEAKDSLTSLLGCGVRTLITLQVFTDSNTWSQRHPYFFWLEYASFNSDGFGRMSMDTITAPVSAVRRWPAAV